MPKRFLLVLICLLCCLACSGCSLLPFLLSAERSSVSTPETVAPPEMPTGADPETEPTPEPAPSSEATPAPTTKAELPASLDVLSAYAGSNLSAGGLAATDGETVWFVQDGLWRTRNDADSAEKLLDGDFCNLCVDRGELYFLSLEYGEDEWGYRAVISQQPCRLTEDGKAEPLREKKRVGAQAVSSWETEDNSAEYTPYLSYTDFTVRDGWAYYIGDVPIEEKTYHVTGPGEWGSVTVKYSGVGSLMRFSLETGETQTLVGDLGNYKPRFTIYEDTIYYTTSYHNALFAYDFTGYHRCALDGQGQEDICTDPTETPMLETDAEGSHFLNIVNGLMACEQGLYASHSDSEGDFRDSRLVKIGDNEQKDVLYEINYLHSLLTPMGILFAGGNRDWDSDLVEDLGLYLRPWDGSGDQKLLTFPEDWVWERWRMNLVNGRLYMQFGTLFFRADLADGSVELFRDGIWEKGELPPGDSVRSDG